MVLMHRDNCRAEIESMVRGRMRAQSSAGVLQSRANGYSRQVSPAKHARDGSGGSVGAAASPTKLRKSVSGDSDFPSLEWTSGRQRSASIVTVTIKELQLDG